MVILGIDIGSRSVKMISMEDGKIQQKKIISTMHFYRDYSCTIENKIKVNFEALAMGKIHKIVSTGYGRNNIQVDNALIINELKAHVYGAIYQTQLKNFTLLDIGGQDFKVIKVEANVITDMLLNDKCAASSGRYLENMATILEIPLDELKKYYKEPVALNNTCAVFAESELIGKIAQGYSVEQLSAGINYSLYKRIKPQVQKLKSKTLVLTGGVAQNEGVIQFLRQDFNEVIIPKEPQLNGAIGCAYLGMIKEEKIKNA